MPYNLQCRSQSQGQRTRQYKLGTEDPDAISAAWMVLYEIVKMKYQASVAAAAPAPAPAAPSTTTPTSSTTDKDTVPKTLPAGVYNQLVKDYNDVALNGEKRTFLEKVLLGADKVLARMHHEHTVSKHYTACDAGRDHVSTSLRRVGHRRTVNSARKKDDLDKRLIVDNKRQLVSKEPSDWDVRGLNMIQDGIDAVRWAWILIKIGTEKAVNKYCDWWVTLVHRNSNKLPQIKTLWESFSWDIAMRMRQTETFNTITEELMADLSTVNDALMQSPKKKPRTGREDNKRYTARVKATQEKVKAIKDGISSTPHHLAHTMAVAPTPHASPPNPPAFPQPNIMPQPAMTWQPPINTWQQQQQTKPAQYQKGNKGRGRGKGQR